VIGIMPVTYRVTADSAEELPEALRKVAKQDGAKFVVDGLPEGFALENVQGLKSTVQKARAEADEYRAVVRQFQEANLAPESAKQAAEALAMMAAGKLKNATEIEDWKRQAEAKAANEAKSLTDKLSKRTDALRAELVRGKLAPLIAAKGGSDSMEELLLIAEQRYIRVKEDNEGNLVAYVVGSDGKTPAITKKSNSMESMGFEELVDLMRETPGTKGCFRVQAAGGSGSTSQSGGTGRVGNQQIDVTKTSPGELVALGNRKNA
jgi:hypothetical protein